LKMKKKRVATVTITKDEQEKKYYWGSKREQQ
jgi:hypothetical protein